MANVYLLKRTDKWSWDDYDSAVVISDSEQNARQIHPSGYNKKYQTGGEQEDVNYSWLSDWQAPDKLEVHLIATNADDAKLGEIVCASFNAG